MIWYQRDFWRAFLAWQLDGCPEPETWWQMRLMAEGVDRVARIIGQGLLPAMRSVALAADAFAASLRAVAG